MSDLARLAKERTELTTSQIGHLETLTAEWTLLADLSFSDLVLWLPTWNNAGYLAAAQVRPSTGPTVYPEDVVGTFCPRVRVPQLVRAMRGQRVITDLRGVDVLTPPGAEAVPVVVDRRSIAVVSRRSALATRDAGQLESVYRGIAAALAEMVADGSFPTGGAQDSTDPPRVGDGLLQLDPSGAVTFASPNARSALRRLGVASDIFGQRLDLEVRRLLQHTGPVDESIGAICAGRAAGTVDVEHADVTVAFRGLPLRPSGVHVSTALLVRDVTDLRRGERALLTKDTTIREIHHRVKNNLQTVAALLRMQGRRLTDPAARAALEESVRRVNAIAVVHETLSHADSDTVDFDAVADRLIALVSDLAVGVRLSRSGRIGLLPGSVASSLALVISELLQNGVEHGFEPETPGAEVRLTAARRANRVTVSVVDNGRGLPPGFDPAGDSRLGLQIVRTLVRDELKGSLSWEPGPGGQGTSATLDLVVPRRPAGRG